MSLLYNKICKELGEFHPQYKNFRFLADLELEQLQEKLAVKRQEQNLINFKNSVNKYIDSKNTYSNILRINNIEPPQIPHICITPPPPEFRKFEPLPLNVRQNLLNYNQTCRYLHKKFRRTKIRLPQEEDNRVYDKNLKIFYSKISNKETTRVYTGPIIQSLTQRQIRKIYYEKKLKIYLNKFEQKLRNIIIYDKKEILPPVRSVMLLFKLKKLIYDKRLKREHKIDKYLYKHNNYKILFKQNLDKLESLYKLYTSIGHVNKINKILTAEGQIQLTHMLSNKQLDVVSNLINSGFSSVAKSLKVKLEDWKGKSVQILCHATGAIASKSPISWIAATIGITHTIGLFDADTYTSLMQLVKLKNKDSTTDKEQPSHDKNTPSGSGQGPKIDLSKDEETEDQTRMWSRFATVTYQGLQSAMDIIVEKPKNMRDWGVKFAKSFRENARSTRGFIDFFENFIIIIKSMVGKILSFWNPELKTLTEMKKYQELSSAWLSEVTDLHNTFAQHKEAWNQHLCHRIEQCIIVAQDFLKTALETPKVYPTNIIANVNAHYKWLLEKRSEGAKMGYSTSARFVPFCVYLFGEVGTGKSEISQEIFQVLSKSMNLNIGDMGNGTFSQDLVFTKPSTAKFFTNCNHQPIIYYDDFEQCASSDTTLSDAATLIYLKSTAPFNPPMAAVEDKYLMYAPKAIVACSNMGWPKPGYIAEPKALWRRRDILVQLKFKDGWNFDKVRAELDPSKKTWDHISFLLYPSPSKLEKDQTPFVYTKDQFIEYLHKTAKNYTERETKNLEQKIKYAEAAICPPSINKGCDLNYRQRISKAQRELADIWYKDVIESPSFKIKDLWYRAKDKLFTKENPVIDATPEEVVQSVIDVIDEKKTTEEIVNLVTDAHKSLAQATEELLKDGPDFENMTEEEKRAYARTLVTDYDAQSEEELPLGADASTIVPTATTDMKLQATPLFTPPVPAPRSVRSEPINNSIPYIPPVLSSNSSEILPAPVPIIQNPPISSIHEAQGQSPEIEIAKPALPVEHKGRTVQPWYQHFTHIVCDHSVADIDNLVYKDGDRYLSNATVRIPIYKCDNCIFKNNHVVRLIREKVGIAQVAFMEVATRKLKDWNHSLITTYNKEADAFKWIKDRLREIVATFTFVMRLIIKILEVTLIIILPAIAFVALFFGIKMGMGAISRRFAHEENPPDFKEAIKTEFHEETTSWRHMLQSERDMAQAIAIRAKTELRNAERHAIPESSPYTFNDASSHAKNVIKSQTLFGVSQGQPLDEAANKIRDATVFITVSGSKIHTNVPCLVTARAVAIGGNWILLPQHYLLEWQSLDPKTITLRLNSKHLKDQQVNPAAIRRVSLPNQELCIIHVPNIPSFSHLTRLFKTETEWLEVRNKNITIVEVEQNYNVRMYEKESALAAEFVLKHNDMNVAKLGPVISYPWTASGRCMSVIVDCRGKIIGFHVAGNSRLGFAEPVVKETFMQLPNMKPVPEDTLTLDEILTGDSQMPSLIIDTNVRTLGKVKQEYIHHQPTNSSKIPSDIHGVFPIYKIPAPLKPCKDNDYTDPLQLGVRKHGLPCYGFNIDILEKATERLKKVFDMRVLNLHDTVRVWNINEACNGVTGIPCLRSIEMGTSEGFPYMFHRPKNALGKHWLLKRTLQPDGRNEYEPCQWLLNVMAHKHELRSKNINPKSIFVDCLKDERLPIEKARTPGKVRIFSITPLDYIIQYRQYFSDFIAAYVSSRGTDYSTYHAIGIAPETLDWTALAFKLQSKGTKILCGDYSNFGPAFAVDVHEAANEVILDWYAKHGADEESQIQRRVMLHEVAHAYHLARDCVYEVACGMPSGSPETVIKNSLVNTLYIFYMWYYIWKDIDLRMASFDNMEKHMYFVTYGDDLIANISDEAAEHFNNETLQRAFAAHGIKYTDESKSATIRPFCTLDEATFLKRKFVPHPFRPHTVLSQMPLEIALDVCNWIEKCPDRRNATKEAAYQTLMLTFGHGPQVYKETEEKISRAMRSIGEKHYTPRTWYEINDLYFKPDCDIIYLPLFDKLYDDCDIADAELCGYGQMSEVMETPVAGNTVTKTEDTIIETHDVPVVVQDLANANTTALLSTSDKIVTLPKLTDRFIVFDNIEWNSTHTGTLASYQVPYDMYMKTLDSPNYKMLQSFAYYRPKFVEIMISINSNKFTMGQLQISSYYDREYDNNRNLRDNVYSRSQMLHTLLDAGSSNSVVLKIPFKHYNPWLTVLKIDRIEPFADLKILVLNQLAGVTPDKTTAHAGIVLAWSMPEVEMMGMRPTLDIVSAQMLPMATGLAMQYLMTRFRARNMDKPPVQQNSSPLEPRATGNLALGTNTCEHLNTLRLDARGQVPHPDLETEDTSTVAIAQRYGLLATINWTSNNGTGTLLDRFPTGPLLPLEEYSTVKIDNRAIDSYRIPPVGVIAGLYDQFSGGTKFRFDVVATQMHTGSFMVAFIPGYVATTDPGYNKAKFAYNVIFDVHEQRSFEFEVPYVTNKPWWPVHKLNPSASLEENPYGTVWVYVVNPLIPMTTIPSKVQINVYHAGASNLRFAIPVQPQFALPWNLTARKPPQDEYVWARSGYYPWYVGTWRNLEGGVKPVLRYGAVTDHIAQFDGLQVGNETSGNWFFYTYEDKSVRWFVAGGSSSETADSTVLIPFNDDDGWGTIYFAVARESDLAGIFVGKYNSTSVPNWDKLPNMGDESKSTYCVGNPRLRRRTFTPRVRVASNDSFELIGDGQGDDPRFSLNSVDQPASDDRSDISMITYGENFTNVKTLLRRYEYVTSVGLTSDNMETNGVGLTFYGLPQGYDIDIRNITSGNMRDGLQPLLLSGFRYFRGSMNYKIAMVNSTGTIWAQHRPNLVVDDLSVRIIPKQPGQRMYQHGYASVLGAVGVNPVLTINVPYYNPNSFMLLQQPRIAELTISERRASSLGQVVCGFNIPRNKSSEGADVHLYRALGDDASPHLFVGFPPLVPVYVFRDW